MQTDEELYELSVEGDDAALKELLSRHGESLTLFLYAITGSREDAEDLELEAFAEAISGRTHFRSRSSFRTWLFAIGRRMALKTLRGKKVSLCHIGEIDPPENENEYWPSVPETRMLHKEESQEVFTAMQELKTEYRECLYLTFFEGMDRREIAGALGKSENQVSNLLYRGRLSLKTILAKKGFSESQ